MQVTQINFLTADNLQLHGLVYQHENNRKLAIFIHGAGDSNVIKMGSMLSILSSKLAIKNYDLMAFNNRGAGYVSKVKKVNSLGEKIGEQMAGMAYERITDCVKDIDGAIDWGSSQGYEHFVLIGHSTGANKTVYYLTEKAKNNKLVSQVFLLAGGDDITLQKSRLDNPSRYLKQITSRVEKDEGHLLVPEGYFPGNHPISYASLLELINEGSAYDIFPFGRYENDKKLFTRYKKIQIPIVAMYGSKDFGTVVPVESALAILREINTNTEVVMLKEADHNFTNQHNQLADQILRRLR